MGSDRKRDQTASTVPKAHMVLPIAAATLPPVVDAEATPQPTNTVAAIRAAMTNANRPRDIRR
jgi:hypothetical protein